MKTYPFMPLVYICSPFRGDVEAHTKQAQAFSRFAVEQGCIPVASHLLYPQFMNDDDPKERDLAIFMGIILSGKCKEVWVLGDRISEGMSREIDVAQQRMQTIRYFDLDFKEVT